jgi:hypothetical protein
MTAAIYRSNAGRAAVATALAQIRAAARRSGRWALRQAVADYLRSPYHLALAFPDLREWTPQAMTAHAKAVTREEHCNTQRISFGGDVVFINARALWIAGYIFERRGRPLQGAKILPR